MSQVLGFHEAQFVRSRRIDYPRETTKRYTPKRISIAPLANSE
jgi:hypothetical protein